MELPFCDPCNVHYKNRSHLYEEGHKERINDYILKDIKSINLIKQILMSNQYEDLTKYFLHCRYCECPAINKAPSTEPFASNK